MNNGSSNSDRACGASDLAEVLTVSDIACFLDVDPPIVLKLIHRGEISATQLRRRYVIPKAALERYLEEEGSRRNALVERARLLRGEMRDESENASRAMRRVADSIDAANLTDDTSKHLRWRLRGLACELDSYIECCREGLLNGGARSVAHRDREVAT